MATSVAFELIDRLLAILPDAVPSGVRVLDGMEPTDDAMTDFVMIGVDDADADGFGDSVESRQEWAGVGARARNEEGTVSCYAESWNGDGDQSAARASLNATVAAIENELRTDPNLGGTVPGLLWTGFGERMTFKQGQGETGAGAAVYFQIAYRARI